jgi:hypothetical protein
MRGRPARSFLPQHFTRSFASKLLAIEACVLLQACASVPQRQYGVHSLSIHGTERMDEEALKVCLATQARERAGLTLGAAGEPECGMPPFDASRLPIALWAWPWTDWPRYDEPVFDRDLSRIQRWYRARGFYEAKLGAVQRQPNDAAHTIDLSVDVAEGEPILVEQIAVQGIDKLDAELQRRVLRAVQFERNARFDEWNYEESKRAILDVVRDASYAKATVEGHTLIDVKRRRAQLTFSIALGRRFRFGEDHRGRKRLSETPHQGSRPNRFGRTIQLERPARRQARHLRTRAVRLRRHRRKAS